jgi:cobalt transporter subunit CbtA
MVKKLVSIALLAGILGGVGVTLFQMVYVVPLILEAETFEVVEEAAGAPSVALPGHNDHDHDHDAEAWAPEDGIERTLTTLGANILTSIGYALLLVGAMQLRGGNITARNGLIWGAAGFVSFSLAPFFGMPPELPGMAAADLASRQIWWAVTVVATAGGLALVTSNSPRLDSPLKIVLGLLLLVAPHTVGAPHLESTANLASDVPAHLSAEFSMAALVHGLILWLAIGLTAGWLYNRFADHNGETAS